MGREKTSQKQQKFPTKLRITLAAKHKALNNTPKKTKNKTVIPSTIDRWGPQKCTLHLKLLILDIIPYMFHVLGVNQALR